MSSGRTRSATQPAWSSDLYASGNQIGGLTATPGKGAGNVISGSIGYGIFIDASVTGNLVQGNVIGTESSSSLNLGNGFGGVAFYEAGSGNTIGGSVAGAANVISGNSGDGIYDQLDSGNDILGNFIGTDASGSTSVPNSGDGVELQRVSDDTVGGTTSGAGNVISGNTSNGVELDGSGTTGNLIEGNMIGTDAAGAASVPNFLGVAIGGSGNDTILGGNGTDIIYGGTGDDTIVGGQGAASILGGSGDDIIYGGTLSSTLSGGSGNDSIFGGNGDDIIYGGTGNSTIIGGTDNDNTLLGGGGQDLIAGLGGNDVIEGSVTRVVYLDFDTFELPGQHYYTDDEREAIQKQITTDFSAFSYVFTQVQPQSGPYATIYFNDPALVGLEGGIATEIDWRDLDISGTTSLTAAGLAVVPPDSGGVNVNNFLGGPGQPAASSADFIGLSATIAAHELGHLSGLDHADAYGPIGSGIYSGVKPGLYNPGFPGSINASETIWHIMASGASVNSTLEDAINDPFFGERESIALAFGASGSPTNEQIAPHDSIGDAQSIVLRRWSCPTPTSRVWMPTSRLTSRPPTLWVTSGRRTERPTPTFIHSVRQRAR